MRARARRSSPPARPRSGTRAALSWRGSAELGPQRGRQLRVEAKVSRGHAITIHDLRIVELPHDLALRRDLERAALLRARDHRVAAGQPLHEPTLHREERLGSAAAIRPHDLLGARIDLDDT